MDPDVFRPIASPDLINNQIILSKLKKKKIDWNQPYLMNMKMTISPDGLML